MSEHHLPATIALGMMIIILVMRAPNAVRQPTSRLTWLASLTGCAALVTVGVVIPLEVVDGWMGGTNMVNLAQNALATTAFWLLMQAALTLDGSRFNARSLWELPVLITAFTIPFLLIPNRAPTSSNFISDHAEHVMLWAYASIYMLAVAAIMLRMLISIRSRKPRMYLLMRIGAGGVIIGSLCEVVYLALRLAQAEPRSAADAVGAAFIPFFYGGVAVTVLGIAGFALARTARGASLHAARILLRHANRAHGLNLESVPFAGDTAHETYQLAVRLADVANSEPLTWRERATLRATSKLLDYRLRAPRVVRLAMDPTPGGRLA